MTTTEQLRQVFADNFVAYFRSHVAHVNVEGRNFYNDHKLLGRVYEDLQSQIDPLAELLRSIGEYMPDNLVDMLQESDISLDTVTGDGEELFELVLADLEVLKSCTEELIETADEEGHKEIANYAQDRILALAKFEWMIKSTLS